ncbi:hypothetical protein FHR75_000034 [Kineococcus radiotolerans]|uniref:Uncharacterized protein n=1 Tax=Kineococcus radiotolerans TaxID=131568 RepID=A0A7W4TJ34_KINRA|nr:hypothetical protein [Kineococcus radiotolerans]MBB2899246.1 hypothetical protein [Kineococcus radiotolerans]
MRQPVSQDDLTAGTEQCRRALQTDRERLDGVGLHGVGDAVVSQACGDVSRERHVSAAEGRVTKSVTEFRS